MEGAIPDNDTRRESFLCAYCRNEIARGRDLLMTMELLDTTDGLFRNAFNVVREQSADPGFDDFFPAVFCSQCNNFRGVLFVRVDQLDWLSGKYFMNMHWLVIRRGNLLLDSVTREVVGSL